MTGEDLLAEIWRETMIRIHSDKPARDLPMSVPEPIAIAEDRDASANDASGKRRRNLLDAIAELLGAKQ